MTQKSSSLSLVVLLACWISSPIFSETPKSAWLTVVSETAPTDDVKWKSLEARVVSEEKDGKSANFALLEGSLAKGTVAVLEPANSELKFTGKQDFVIKVPLLASNVKLELTITEGEQKKTHTVFVSFTDKPVPPSPAVATPVVPLDTTPQTGTVISEPPVIPQLKLKSTEADIVSEGNRDFGIFEGTVENGKLTWAFPKETELTFLTDSHFVAKIPLTQQKTKVALTVTAADGKEATQNLEIRYDSPKVHRPRVRLALQTKTVPPIKGLTWKSKWARVVEKDPIALVEGSIEKGKITALLPEHTKVEMLNEKDFVLKVPLVERTTKVKINIETPTSKEEQNFLLIYRPLDEGFERVFSPKHARVSLIYSGKTNTASPHLSWNPVYSLNKELSFAPHVGGSLGKTSNDVIAGVLNAELLMQWHKFYPVVTELGIGAQTWTDSFRLFPLVSLNVIWNLDKPLWKYIDHFYLGYRKHLNSVAETGLVFYGVGITWE